MEPFGSIVFTPEETMQMMKYVYDTYPKTWSKYGFLDGYNLQKDKLWVSKEYIGIDKGISMVMIENYLHRNNLEIYNEK